MTSFAGSARAMTFITNPSFELGSGGVTFSSSSEFGGADAFELTSISNEIPDWRWEQSGQGLAVWLEFASNRFATDGTHLLYLDTNQGIEWLDVGNALLAGATYRLDFNFATWERGQDLAPGGAESGEGTILLEYSYRDTLGDLKHGVFAVSIRPPANGDSAAGDLTWLSSSESLLIPADYGSDFRLSITSAGTGMLLDELSLAVVPEPGTVALVGLAGLLALRRSRRG